MNPEERLELIRSKASAKQKAAEVAKPIVTRKPGLIVRGSHSPTAYGIGPRLSAPNRVVEWVVQPEQRETEWEPSQRHEPHALTRIAEKLKRGWH